jgi:hypothetical protein
VDSNSPLQRPLHYHPEGPAATAAPGQAGLAAPAAEILSDYQQVQKKSDITFWASVGFGVVAVLAVFYIFNSQVIQPKRSKWASLQAQAATAKTTYEQNLKKSQSLPELKELLHVMNAKWEDVYAEKETQRHSWFFKGYWEVLEGMFQTMGQTMIQSGVLPREMKATIYDVGNRTALYSIQWSPGKMRKVSESWNIKKVVIGEAEDKLEGANLLNPIPFEAKCVGEYENLMRMVDRLFYDSPYFYALVSVKLSRVTTARTLGTFTPLGAWVEAEIKGAAFHINPTGNPTLDLGVPGAGQGPGGMPDGGGTPDLGGGFARPSR